MGIIDKIIRLTGKLYSDNTLFRLGNIETDEITDNTGVRQECVMSPTLFNISLEEYLELLIRIRKTEV